MNLDSRKEKKGTPVKEHFILLLLLSDLPTHGFTVRLKVWGLNSRSYDLASKSHGESENLQIAKQFR